MGARGHIFLLLGILEIDDQHAMASSQLDEIGQLATHGHDTAETGVDNHQAALGDMAVHSVEQGREIGLAERCLLSIEALEDVLHVARTALGGNERVELVAEGAKTRLVLLVHGDIREYERGIDGIVEEGHPMECMLHDTSFVDDVEHLLRPLVLIDIHHEMTAPRRSLPVDGAEVVACHIVLDLLELGVVADTTNAFDAQFCQSVADGQQLVFVKHQIGRIDLHIAFAFAGDAPLDKSQNRLHKHADVAKAIDATLGGTQPIGDGLHA